MVTKENYMSHAKELFQDTEVNITSHRRPYLGTALGSDVFCDQFVADKVVEWQNKLFQLAKVATMQPHATNMYSAFIHGLIHRFTYISQTMSNKDHLVQPLEDTIRTKLIPAWTGKVPPTMSSLLYRSTLAVWFGNCQSH